jgi:hypothetical protein
VQVVEDEHVQAAVERPGVGDDVGLDRSGRVEGLVRPLNRDVHEAEGVHLLRLPVLAHFEVFAPQVVHELPVLRVDGGIDLDVIDLGAERDSRRRIHGARRLGRLTRVGRRSGQAGQEQRQQKTETWACHGSGNDYRTKAKTRRCGKRTSGPLTFDHPKPPQKGHAACDCGAVHHPDDILDIVVGIRASLG